MIVERRQEVERLFEAAVERDGAARAAYLDAACSGDAELRRHVSTLLDADASPSWLDAGPERLATSLLDDTPAAELIGSDIGPYRDRHARRGGSTSSSSPTERHGQHRRAQLLRDTWVRRPAATTLSRTGPWRARAPVHRPDLRPRREQAASGSRSSRRGPAPRRLPAPPPPAAEQGAPALRRICGASSPAHDV